MPFPTASRCSIRHTPESSRVLRVQETATFHDPGIQDERRDIGGGTRPPHDQPPLLEEETEFAADNPAMIRDAFAADLLRAAPLAHGVDQLDAIGVDDAEHRRSGQEDLRPVLTGREEAQEPRPLGEPGKQSTRVARRPALEGPVAHAFEGMQQPQSDDLAWPQDGVGVFGETWQMVIDLTE